MTILATGVATASCAHDDIGTGVWVHDFRIEGNHALSRGSIRDKLATQVTGWWPFARKKWFDQAAFDLDLRRIPAVYADHGYFDAHVVSHEVTQDGDAVDVTLVVQEGQPTKIRTVDIRGLPAPADRRSRKLAHAEKVEPGQVFNYQ